MAELAGSSGTMAPNKSAALIQAGVLRGLVAGVNVFIETSGWCRSWNWLPGYRQ